ncbi:MAG TPA: methyltransferase domain-containing protein [Chitinophagaceae bacterium]
MPELLFLRFVYIAFMHYHAHLRSAVSILELYRGNEPFSSFLKKHFAANKKFGSKDRRQITHLCYCYFRLGKLGLSIPVEERIITGLFFCSAAPNDMLAALRPEWNEEAALGVKDKCSMLNAQYSINNVFPWKTELSPGVDYEKFCESFFIQPDVFLRLRPGHETKVRQKLANADIAYVAVGDTSIALPSASKLDQVLALDDEAMVQDLNSQQVGRFYKTALSKMSLPFISAWDCCAGSGGKSLMLFDLQDKLELVVSDKRESILYNLKKRFQEHGIKNYKAVIADLAKSLPANIKNSKFNMIICDAPCSGSGTWGRTPEQLYYFDKKMIDEYATLQKKIVSNAVGQLQKGGMFVYITCSVFKKENEEVVQYMQQNFPLELIEMKIMEGYDKKADTMFAALLRLP